MQTSELNDRHLEAVTAGKDAGPETRAVLLQKLNPSSFHRPNIWEIGRAIREDREERGER